MKGQREGENRREKEKGGKEETQRQKWIRVLSRQHRHCSFAEKDAPGHWGGRRHHGANKCIWSRRDVQLAPSSTGIRSERTQTQYQVLC